MWTLPETLAAISTTNFAGPLNPFLDLIINGPPLLAERSKRLCCQGLMILTKFEKILKTVILTQKKKWKRSKSSFLFPAIALLKIFYFENCIQIQIVH